MAVGVADEDLSWHEPEAALSGEQILQSTASVGVLGAGEASAAPNASAGEAKVVGDSVAEADGMEEEANCAADAELRRWRQNTDRDPR